MRSLRARKRGWRRFYRLFERVTLACAESPYDEGINLNKPKLEKIEERFHPFAGQILEYRTAFLDAMDDDFNTASAISVLFQSASAINRLMDEYQVETLSDQETRQLVLQATRTLLSDGRILGLFLKPPVQSGAGVNDALCDGLVQLLITLRQDAKAQKNFELADKIRNSLSELDIVLEDTKDGVRWKLK